MHPIAELVKNAPDKAGALVLEAFREAGASQLAACELLRCHESTMIRWIARLQLREKIEALRARAIKEGWFHGNLGGRPIGRFDSVPRTRSCYRR